MELLEQGMWAGGSQRNLVSVQPFVESTVDDPGLKMLADAQTSGGLLVAVPPTRAPDYIGAVPGAASIGQITAGTGIVVTP
jgi:selenophosphate synthase